MNVRNVAVGGRRVLACSREIGHAASRGRLRAMRSLGQRRQRFPKYFALASLVFEAVALEHAPNRRRVPDFTPASSCAWAAARYCGMARTRLNEQRPFLRGAVGLLAGVRQPLHLPVDARETAR